MKFIKTHLASGLRTVVVTDKDTPYVYISLLGNVGRRAEEGKEVGMAHFLEHLFFDGTKKRPSAYEINKFIEDHGGAKNGFTSQETVQYFVKILSTKAEIGFEYLSDIFFNSLLNDIEKERKVIAQEAKMRHDNPNDLLIRMRLNSLFPNQTIGQTIFDEEKNLQNISRELLINYKQRAYVKENFILLISGKINETSAIKMADNYFPNFNAGKKIEFSSAFINKDQQVKIINKELEQAKLSISFRGYPAYSTNSFLTRLIMVILGGGFSSRLYNKLRNELRLVYFIKSAHRPFSDTGFSFIETFMSEKNLQKSLDEIFIQINRLLDKGVTGEELSKSKNIVISRILFELDNAIDLGEFYADQWILNKEIKGVNHFIKIIKSATISDLADLSHEIFSDKPKIDILVKETQSVKVNF